MPRDTPDWGATTGGGPVYLLQDLGELAVRLGSPISHDRRGDVIWWDDFEWSLNKWATNAGGGGGAVALSTAYARNGRTSVLITAGDGPGNESSIIHRAPYLVLSGFGVEESFLKLDNFQYHRLGMSVYNGTQETRYQIRIDDVAAVIQYLDSTGAWVTFGTGIDLDILPTLFHTLKVVVRAELGSYERVILDNQSFSLSGISAQQLVSGTSPLRYISIGHEGIAGTNPDVHVDDVILTQNEPV